MNENSFYVHINVDSYAMQSLICIACRLKAAAVEGQKKYRRKHKLKTGGSSSQLEEARKIERARSRPLPLREDEEE